MVLRSFVVGVLLLSAVAVGYSGSKLTAAGAPSDCHCKSGDPCICGDSCNCRLACDCSKE